MKTTFKKTVEVHNMEPEKWAPILALQLTGKRQEAHAAMENEDAKNYQKAKQAILQRYNINEETYLQSFRSVKPKEETPVEFVTQIRGLAKKCETREQVIDTIVKEHSVLALPEDVRVGVGVDDILLDTGCSRILLRRELVKLEKFREGKLVCPWQYFLSGRQGGPGC